jgi:hypothetical protein
VAVMALDREHPPSRILGPPHGVRTGSGVRDQRVHRVGGPDAGGARRPGLPESADAATIRALGGPTASA